jgi:hypothetical protein
MSFAVNLTWKQVRILLLNPHIVKEADDGGGRYDYTHIYHEIDSCSIAEATYHAETFSFVVGNNDDAHDVRLNIWDDTCFEYKIVDGNLYIKCNDDDPNEAWELTLMCYSKINLLTIVNTLV